VGSSGRPIARRSGRCSNKDRAGVGDAEAAALGVAVGGAAGESALGGQVAAGPARQGQPGVVQGRVDAPVAIRGQRGGSGQECQALVDEYSATADRLAIDEREEG
jgi:hypothetical protein